MGTDVRPVNTGGVPPVECFYSRDGGGTPLVLDLATGILYYLSLTGVVTATSGGGGGGITQLTGDVTAGPGAGAQAATLASTAVTPGSYTHTSLTVDAKGRLTAAASGSVPTAIDLYAYSFAGGL